jgi:hypothetical protein
MARNAFADIEAALGGVVAMARETATPLLGGGRYVNDRMYGTEDASEAMDWAENEMSEFKMPLSPAGETAQKEMVEFGVNTAREVYDTGFMGIKKAMESNAVQGAVERADEWWQQISPDVKAGLEMLGGALDFNPMMAGAGIALKAGKLGKQGKKLLDANTFYHTTPRGVEIPEGGFKPGSNKDGTYFTSNPEYAQASAPEFRSAEPGAGFEDFDQTGTTYPSNLGMQNPKYIKNPSEADIEKYTGRGFDRESLVDEGYDGIVLQHKDGEVEAQAFFPEQISTATGKQPVYAQNAQELAGGLKRNPAGYGLKVDAGRKHQISGVNLPRQFDDLTFALAGTPQLEPAQVKRFQDMVKSGDVLVPLLGDPTRGGRQTLTHVNDVELSKGIEQWGGRGFARGNIIDPATGKPFDQPLGWGSGSGVTSALRNKGIAGLEESGVPGAEAIGMFTMMSPRSSAFFSDQLAHTHMDLVNQKMPDIPDDKIDAFDAHMARFIDKENLNRNKKAAKEAKKNGTEYTQPKQVPGFVGMKDPDWQKQLNDAPDLRKQWLEVQSKAEHTKAGFPDVASSVKANYDEGLIHQPPLSTGGMLSRLDVDKPNVPGLIEQGRHNLYDSGMPGQYIGEQQVMIPAQDMFHDYFNSPDFTESEGSAQYMMDRVKPIQHVTDEHIERITKLEDKKLQELIQALGG